METRQAHSAWPWTLALAREGTLVEGAGGRGELGAARRLSAGEATSDLAQCVSAAPRPSHQDWTLTSESLHLHPQLLPPAGSSHPRLLLLSASPVLSSPASVSPLAHLEPGTRLMSQLTEPVEKVKGPAVGKGRTWCPQGRVGPLGVLLTWPFPGAGLCRPGVCPGTVSPLGPEQCPAPGGGGRGWAGRQGSDRLEAFAVTGHWGLQTLRLAVGSEGHFSAPFLGV